MSLNTQHDTNALMSEMTCIRSSQSVHTSSEAQKRPSLWFRQPCFSLQHSMPRELDSFEYNLGYKFAMFHAPILALYEDFIEVEQV